MKIIKKVKKFIVLIGIFFTTLTDKVFAVSKNMKEIQVQPEYGVPPVLTVGDIIWNICKISFVPVVLLIGIIIYFKKSKDSNIIKVIFTLTILAIIFLLYFLINR